MSETPVERVPDGLHQVSRQSTTGAEGYDVVGGDLPQPVLSGVVTVAPDLDSLVELMAADLFVHAERSLIIASTFHMALTVGPIQMRLYERLMCDVTLRSFPWSRTHLWMAAQCIGGDEYQEIHETLVLHSGIPEENVHPWKPQDDDPPGHEYASQLESDLEARPSSLQRLDYALLGLDSDGGVAAIRPGSNAAQTRGVCAVEGPSDQRWLTLGLDVLSRSRFISVVAAGSDIAPTVELVRSMTESGAEDLPIMGLSPHQGGHLKWYLDRDACPPEEPA